MTEFLMPSIYKGESSGISVMFAGLDEEAYISLEVSIDGISYIKVERDKDLFYSLPYAFDNLVEKTIYCIYGRAVTNTTVYLISCNFSAVKKSELITIEYIARQSGGASQLPKAPEMRVFNGNR